MQQFDNKPSARSSRRPLVAAAAVVLIAGASFAAVGGVQTIRNWLVRVQVNGHDARILVPDGGSGSMVIEEDNGDRTTIEVSQQSAADGGETTRVKVVRRGEGLEDEDVAEIVRERRFEETEDVAYTVEDLRDAEAVFSWENGELTNELYFVPSEDEGITRVFMMTIDSADEATVQLVAPIPSERLGFADPQFEIDDDGVLIIKSDDGAGRVEVMKFMIVQVEALEDLPELNDMRVETPDGEVRIQIEESEDPGEDH